MPRRLASPPSPLPFAAPGGAPACRVLRLGEATLPGNAGSWSARAGPGREGGPGRSSLAPCSTGPLHLPWGPPEGGGPGLCDTLSRASQSPDPRCLQALGGELSAQRPVHTAAPSAAELKWGHSLSKPKLGNSDPSEEPHVPPFCPPSQLRVSHPLPNVWSQLL